MNSNTCPKRLLATTVATLFMVATLFLINGGCGLVSFRNPDFDNAETGEDGQTFVLDDLEAIAADPDLSDDEKRDAFAELGIEDPDLIDALLN
ncbi:MAG: hypothetical protein GXP29_06720 [Planctomycetes bacterium]|nr:hypothetical protein [Planctomycetota bacterium]